MKRLVAKLALLLGSVSLALVLCKAILVATHHRGTPLSIAPQVVRQVLREKPSLPYQIRSPDNPDLVLLSPGFTWTITDYRLYLLAKDNPLTRRLRKRFPADSDEIALRINSAGFRGPELQEDHRFRILCLGDSCTFGPIGNEGETYPGALQRLIPGAEVINAGIEGHAPRETLMRMAQLRELRANLVIVYTGWNAIYQPLRSDDGLLDFAKAAFAAVRRRHHGYARAQLEKEKHPDRNTSELATLARWEPPFLAEVEQIVEEFQSIGSKVAICTLPGLFLSDEDADERSLRIGHLPEWTYNPYALAQAFERYNECLRALATKKGALLIDLEAWRRELLSSDDFSDTVHLEPESQVMLAEQVALRIVNAISDQ